MTPQQQEIAEREARLSALAMALPVHGYIVEVEEDRLRVTSEDSDDVELRIWCAPRLADGGRLWFMAESEPPTGPLPEPMAEASGDIMWALVAVKGLFPSARHEGP
jgi:hypothetical protein